MHVKLKVMGGTHEGKEIAVKDEKFLIGRSESCQLRPKSDSISRKHCVLVLKDGRVLVADLKSRNGTLVNDVKLDPERAKVLRDGDVLQVGQLKFEVLVEHGLGGIKKPVVTSVQEAAQRMASSSSSDDDSSTLSVADWLLEADSMDRDSRISKFNNETRMLSTDETAQLSPEEVQELIAEVDTDSQKRPDKRAPIKMPKSTAKSGPNTQNSKFAAEQTLKKYFGGR